MNVPKAKPIILRPFPDIKPMFALWVKFKDGETRTFSSRELEFTQAQVLYRPELVIRYQDAFNRLVKLIEGNLKGKYAIAKIYLTPTNDVLKEYRDGKLITVSNMPNEWWQLNMPDRIHKLERK